MVRPGQWHWVLCIAVMLAGNATAAEEETAQAALDKATEIKLSAENIADLNQVIKLCQEAITLGLDEENKKFANGLLAGTLTQRADLVCLELFERPVTPNRAGKLVQMALSDLEQSLKIDPEQALAQYLIGRLYSHLEEPEKALAALDAAVRLSEDDQAARSKALMIRANLKTDPAARRADYDEAVKLQPHDPNALRFRGMFLMTQNELPAATADFNAALAIDPKDADTREALGLAQSLAQKYDEAMESFNQVLEQAPESATALTHRARVRAIKGDAQQALADVERALKLQPGSVAALQLHATLLSGAGKFEQALAEMNLLRKAMPDNPDVLLQVAVLYQAIKQPLKAVTAYDQLLEVNPDNTNALRGRADVYLSLSKQAEAIADYEKAIELEPKNSGVLNNLAWVLATSPEDKLRDGKRAIELAKRACELTEYKQAHILSTLAAGFAETGDFETAISWSKKAVELGPEPMKGQLSKELESYQGEKPWREDAPPTDDSEPEQTAQEAAPDRASVPASQDTAGNKRGS